MFSDASGNPLLQEAAKTVFLSLWIVGSFLLLVRVGPRLAKKRLRQRRIRSFREPAKPREGGFLQKIAGRLQVADELEFAEWRIAPELLLAGALAFLLIGIFGSQLAIKLLQEQLATGADRFARLNPWLLNACIGLITGALPIFLLKFAVQKKRRRIALKMIMLTQNIIGHYSPALTLTEVLTKSARTMPIDVRKEWNRLILNLHMQSAEEALHDFARRIDNHWADDLADLMLMGAQYGTDITQALHKLVSSMQKAKSNEEKRMAMVAAYRIGTLLMIGFAVFAVLFNCYADTGNFRHYFLESGGRRIITFAVLVLFASLAMVVRSGRKPF